MQNFQFIRVTKSNLLCTSVHSTLPLSANNDKKSGCILQPGFNCFMHTARMQVRQMEERQGYFTCYYYGMRKLEQWHRESGLDNLSYTRLLFSLGHCSLSTFHRFLQLCDADKTALLHDFSPLE